MRPFLSQKKKGRGFTSSEAKLLEGSTQARALAGLRFSATLEAMTRQVEMLREEEDGLRRSISLLQVNVESV